MKKTAIALLAVLALTVPQTALSGSFSDAIKSFLEIKSQRKMDGRNAALNFGSENDPKYVILNRIQPDAVGESEPSDWALDSEDAGAPAVSWTYGPFGACPVTCGTGTRLAQAVCVDRNGNPATGCPEPAPEPAEQACSSTSSCVSCKGLLSAGVTGSGVHTLASGLDVWCDMESDGGGWTLVARQYEASPIVWNGGGMASYDPDFSSLTSFSLATAQLPSDRTQTGFGKDSEATFAGFADYVYKTTAIGRTLVTNLKSGNKAHIARYTNAYYPAHNPEETRATSTDPNSKLWWDTLTFDETGGRKYNWSFARRHSTRKYRGYALSGGKAGSADAFAWTVWVR